VKKPGLAPKLREKLMQQYGGRMPTQEEVFEKIRASQERLMTALVGMAKTAPNDPEIKKQLMEAMQKAAELRKKVYKQVLKQKPPQINHPEEEKES